MSMSHRQRALAALNHQEPDRVPLDLGSTRNTSMLVEAYAAVIQHLDIEEREEEYAQTTTARLANPSERVLELLDVDFRGIFLGNADHPLSLVLADGGQQDELGVIREKAADSHYYDITCAPFDRADVTVADVANWRWPDPCDPGYTRGLREKALWLRQNTDYAVTLHLQDIITHPSQYMRGFERWYMDFVLDPDIICALMDALLEIRIVQTERALGQVGDLIDVVSCSDDVADQRGPQVSPDMYRKHIKPRHKRYFEMMRSATQAKILFHSCGSVVQLIPDFIDMGIDFINPVQVSAAGMETKRLKQEYGQDIGYWGAIDTTQVLPFGTPHEVEEEVKLRIRDLGPGGGYVLSAVHNIQPIVPAQNVLTMYEAAKRYGTYPISC